MTGNKELEIAKKTYDRGKAVSAFRLTGAALYVAAWPALMFVPADWTPIFSLPAKAGGYALLLASAFLRQRA
jgi:hypothetical protein